tara:strand:- start:883 stop:1608 length:726 start_codon:yes stop_codon:yes gene_type:complete
VSEIPRIGVNSIRIEPVRTYIINAPKIDTPNVPVVLPMGFPVVNIPGCVEARRSYENENLVNTDKKSNLILCDAQYPSYDAMNFTPSELIYTEESQPQRYEQPETPAQDPPPPPKIEDCPPIGAAEIGSKIEDGKKEIIAYQLIGNKCITQYKKLTMTQRVVDAVPSPPQIISTTAITLIATSTALATPVLLKIVRPLVKQIINRVKKKLTGKEEHLSLKERRLKQREITASIRALKKMKK